MAGLVSRPCRYLPACLWALAASLVLPACSLVPDPVVPASVAALPDEFEQADVAVAAPYRPLGWWKSYDDPVLDALVERALARNLDLREAVARVEQARAQVRVERAGLWPDIGAGVEASRRDQADGGGGGQAPGGPGGDFGGGGPGTGESYSATLDLSYELDFWGRVRNAANAAEARVGASIGDLQTAVLSVIAETMRAYFDILFLEQRLDLARANADLLRERAELTGRRYLRGLTDSFEFYAIRGQLRTAEAGIPQLESQLYSAEARLSTLLGGYPGRMDDVLRRDGPMRVRLALDPIPPGLPSALLIQRPDVRAAWLRLEAQRFDVGAVRASLFPQVSLSGGAGLAAGGLGGLFDFGNWVTSLVAGLTAPVFSGGRLTGQVDAAEAGLARQASAYANTVLVAFREVETALNGHENTVARYRLLRRDLETARASADLQLRRYTQGVGDYLAFLDARRNLVDARVAAVEAERDLAEARLAVHRALGGAWIEEDLSVQAKELIAGTTGEEVHPPAAAQAEEAGDV